MSYIQQAINLAKSDAAGDKMWFYDGDCDEACDSSIFIDPAFWQALGKARGWIAPPSGQAYFYQHRFIDHLAGGKDAESFFAELLK